MAGVGTREVDECLFTVGGLDAPPGLNAGTGNVALGREWWTLDARCLEVNLTRLWREGGAGLTHQ